MSTAESKSNVDIFDEFHDCLVDSTAIAHLLMDSHGDANHETTSRAGYMILEKLERAKKLSAELWDWE